MTWKAGVAVFMVSFVVAWGVTRVLVRSLRDHGLLDVPNERSSHRVPTPRGGGIGVLAGVAGGWLVCRWLELPILAPPVIAGALLVALASAADDYLGGVSLAGRAAAQFVAAGLVVWRLGGLPRLPLPAPADLPLGILGVPLAVFWIVGVTNIFNFLDGIDGFAASQGVVAGTSAALLFPESIFAFAGLSLAGACAGFLIFNWHPARIFLGDVGSAPLGFLFAVLPFEVPPEERGRTLFLVAICLWCFLSDGAFTLLRRLFRGERVWEPHRCHLYQRLVRAGLRHDTVVLIVMTLSVPIAALAVVAGGQHSAVVDWGVLVIALIFFLGYLWWTRRLEFRASGIGERSPWRRWG